MYLAALGGIIDLIVCVVCRLNNKISNIILITMTVVIVMLHVRIIITVDRPQNATRWQWHSAVSTDWSWARHRQ